MPVAAPLREGPAGRAAQGTATPDPAGPAAEAAEPLGVWPPSGTLEMSSTWQVEQFFRLRNGGNRTLDSWSSCPVLYLLSYIQVPMSGLEPATSGRLRPALFH